MRARRDKSAKGTQKEGGRLWIWADYTSRDRYAIGIKCSGLPEKAGAQLALGQPITEMPRRVAIRDITGKPLPDVLGTPTVYPAVSRRVREVLESRSRANIQFVPVQLRGFPKEPYWLPHVLDELALVDRKRSRVEWDPDDPRYIQSSGSMVLRDPPPGAPLYFRLAEIPALIVDRELKEALQRVTPSAGHFIDPWELGE